MILAMGGTADGRELVRRLTAAGHRVIVTTATEYGAQLLREHGQEQAHATRLDQAGFVEFIRRYEINTLIDATHPYADMASRTAIEACRATGCRYLRFERQAAYLDDFPGTLVRVPGYRQAAEWARDHSQGPILLTTGSKTLATFVEILGTERLVARVLPTVESLRQCHQLGLVPRQIVAMQGPFSRALNIALIEQFAIRLIVSKDSGETGGMTEKLAAAAHCSVPFLLIDRPSVDYPNRYHDMAEILETLSEVSP